MNWFDRLLESVGRQAFAESKHERGRKARNPRKAKPAKKRKRLMTQKSRKRNR